MDLGILDNIIPKNVDGKNNLKFFVVQNEFSWYQAEVNKFLQFIKYGGKGLSLKGGGEA